VFLSNRAYSDQAPVLGAKTPICLAVAGVFSTSEDITAGGLIKKQVRIITTANLPICIPPKNKSSVKSRYKLILTIYPCTIYTFTPSLNVPSAKNKEAGILKNPGS
jgi:hypothetical protein